MTTKPKVNRFRTRRDAPSYVAGDAGDAGAAATDAAGADASGTRQDGAQPANTDIDAIRREALSGQQLRMARRVARKHGLSPGSDLDAVRLLRLRGIDPFVQNPIRALVARGDDDAGGRGAVALPRTEPATTDAKQATEASPAARRAALLAEPAVARARPREAGSEVPLGGQIGFGEKIARPLGGHGEAAPVRPVAQEDVPRLTGEGRGKIKILGRHLVPSPSPRRGPCVAGPRGLM